mmetsp:Transcript_4495/g.9841  ORF Transcript_4495/g.9841 Transcript_4495/m.9841 type:complete len:309 (-) Transcript_4495:460-1386(-)
MVNVDVVGDFLHFFLLLLARIGAQPGKLGSLGRRPPLLRRGRRVPGEGNQTHLRALGRGHRRWGRRHLLHGHKIRWVAGVAQGGARGLHNGLLHRLIPDIQLRIRDVLVRWRRPPGVQEHYVILGNGTSPQGGLQGFEQEHGLLLGDLPNGVQAWKGVAAQGLAELGECHGATPVPVQHLKSFPDSPEILEQPVPKLHNHRVRIAVQLLQSHEPGKIIVKDAPGPGDISSEPHFTAGLVVLVPVDPVGAILIQAPPPALNVVPEFIQHVGLQIIQCLWVFCCGKPRRGIPIVQERKITFGEEARSHHV